MNSASCHYVSGGWMTGVGPDFESTDPATGQINWSGRAATTAEVDRAVTAARDAFPGWSALGFQRRAGAVRAIAEAYRAHRAELVECICRETGKPRWEASAEVDVMIAKAAVSIEACEKRTADSLSVGADGVTSATRFKPHGVVAVLGPFNMPGHLPNGHLIPALLAGNTVVFKSSEQTPLVGQRLAEAVTAAGLPAGVFNLLQGGPQTGGDLARHPQIDGLFFTGSATAGAALNRALADQPHKILALEMGGNNPLVFHDASSLEAASHVVLQSAFISAGQRCSCARRLIVVDGPQAQPLLNRLVFDMSRLRVGLHTDEPEPFMGPVIHARAAEALVAAHANLVKAGGRPLVPLLTSPRSPALLAPALIDVTDVSPREDVELFGPILQVIRVKHLAAALQEANATRYGLSAGLISGERAIYDTFFAGIRAGIVNWNRPLTGASSRLPFGGVGRSGNHRPSAYFAADYCAYPVGSMEVAQPALPTEPAPGVTR